MTIKITRKIRWIFLFFLLALPTLVLAQSVSLQQKIGQMLLVGFSGTEADPDTPIARAILAQQVGGVILFDHHVATKAQHYNIENPTQLKHLTQQLQRYAQQAAMQNKNGLLPLLISVDYEGGKANRLKENDGFPKTWSAAEIGVRSYVEAREIARQMAETLWRNGINLNFAPVVDINVNPNDAVINKFGRSFSRDPKQVIADAQIFAEEYQKHGVVCTYKHFPGHGSAARDTHRESVDVSKTWQKIELEPYAVLFKAEVQCPLVMTAHVVNTHLDKQGYPASLSVAITTGLLRKQLGFKGVVVTDDLQMRAITQRYNLAESVRLAINAGADILVFANQLTPTMQDPQQIIDLIYADVMAGKIPVSRIEESYQRIMQLKHGW